MIVPGAGMERSRRLRAPRRAGSWRPQGRDETLVTRSEPSSTGVANESCLQVYVCFQLDGESQRVRHEAMAGSPSAVRSTLPEAAALASTQSWWGFKRISFAPLRAIGLGQGESTAVAECREARGHDCPLQLEGRRLAGWGSDPAGPWSRP